MALPTAKERAHAHRGDQLFAGFIVCWICCVLSSLAFFFVASWHHSRVDWQIQMLLAEEQLAAVKRAPTVRLESRTGCPTGRSGDRPQQQQQQRRRGRRERGEEEQEQHEQGNPTAFLAHRAHGSSSPSLSPRLTNRLSTLAEQTEPASSPVLAACVTVAPASATESSLSPASSTKSHFSMGLGPGGVLFEASLLAQRAAFEEMKRHRGDGAGGAGDGGGGNNDDDDGDEVSRGQKELRRLTFAAFSWAGKQLGEGSSNPHSSDHMAAHVGTGGDGTSEGKMEEGRSELKQQQQHHETMKEKVRRHVSVSPHLLVHRSAPHKGPEEQAKSPPKVEEEPKLEVEKTEREKDKLRVSPSYVDRDKRKDSTPISSAVSWDGSLCTDEAGYERIQSALGREGLEGRRGGGGGGGEEEKVGERTDEGDDFATVPETFDVQFDVRTVHVGESHDAEISMGQPGTELCDVDGSDIATVVVLDQARRVASHVVDDDSSDDNGNTTDGQRGDRAVLHPSVPNNDSQKAMTSPLLTPLRAGPVAERGVSNYPFPSTPSPGPSMAPQLQQQQRSQLLELPVVSTDNSVDSDQRHRQEAREHAENVLNNAQARAPPSPWTFGQP